MPRALDRLNTKCRKCNAGWVMPCLQAAMLAETEQSLACMREKGCSLVNSCEHCQVAAARSRPASRMLSKIPATSADATRSRALARASRSAPTSCTDAVRAIVAPALGRAVTAATLGGCACVAGRS